MAGQPVWSTETVLSSKLCCLKGLDNNDGMDLGKAVGELLTLHLLVPSNSYFQFSPHLAPQIVLGKPVGKPIQMRGFCPSTFELGVFIIRTPNSATSHRFYWL